MADPDEVTGEMPFLDHVRELRARLLRSLAAVVVMFVVAMLLYPKYVDYFTEPFYQLIKTQSGTQQVQIAMTEIQQGFMLQFRVSGYIAVVLSFPLHLYNAIAFIGPALHRREQLLLRIFTWCGLVLAIAGAWLAYFHVLPTAVSFLANFKPDAVVNLLDYRKSVLFVFQLVLAFVVLFQSPLVLLILMHFNIVKRSWLLSMSRYIIVGIFLLSALVTPPEIVSQVMLAIPLVGMFFGSILIAKIFGMGEDSPD